MSQDDLIAGYFSDAVESDDGDRYLGFGGGERRCYVSLVDISQIDKKLVKRLARAGATVVATSDKEALKRAVRAVTDFRKVTIVKSPGWTKELYGLPSGALISREKRNDETILAYDPDVRFNASTDLAAWQDAVGPFVRGQPLVLFCLSFALVGPLLRFAPPDVQNPIIELVGETGKGKSTLAKLMSSVWGGDPNAFLGICRDWDFTPAELDGLRRGSRDGLLILDEVNRASKDENEKAKIVGSAMFKLADTSSRQRFGEEREEPIRQAVLSTSNVPIRELTAMKKEVKDAMLSRILSMECNRPYGIFDFIPGGFIGARPAAKAMNAAATTNFGSVAPAYLAQLRVHDDERIKKAVAKGIRLAETRGLSDLVEGPRVSNTVAMAYTAGLLARELGIFPKSWGRFDHAFRVLFTHRQEDEPSERRSSALDKINAYIDANREDMILATDASLPTGPEGFKRMPGIWMEGGKRLVVSTSYLDSRLPDCIDLLRQIRDLGRLDHDSSQLSKKAPRGIAKGGRAYFINVDPTFCSALVRAPLADKPPERRVKVQARR